MRSLPAEVKGAVNVCLGAHFPDLVDGPEDKTLGGTDFYGDVFLG